MFKNILTSLLLAVLMTACVSTPKPCGEQNVLVDDLGRTRLIVYKKNDVYKRPGAMSAMSNEMSKVFAESFGFDFIKPIPDSNAFVIEGEKGKPIEAPRGWAIEEEKIYHVHAEGVYKLVPFDCPQNPPPTHPPTTPPPPGNGSVINTTWGQKAVRAAEASQIVPETSVKICDIDTGLDRSVLGEFPSGTIREGFSAVPGEAWDDDAGGNHGTHTAGTIASKTFGVARATSLYICKALSSRNGSGSSSSLAGCISKCRTWGARVINASWGMDQGTDAAIGAAVDGFVQSGGVFVASAGNSSGGPIGFPASKSNVIAVTSMDQAGRLSRFSSKGNKNGDMVMAPGSDIPSLPRGRLMSGTSMSAPHVTAIVALALQKGRTTIKTITKNLPVIEEGRGLADALETVK